MPYLDITAAQKELDAEHEPLIAEIRGVRYTFPGVMPAAVEAAQMEIARATEGMKDSEEAPNDSTDRLLHAMFAEQYDRLMQDLTLRELGDLLGWLMDQWQGDFGDPKRMEPRLRAMRKLQRPVAQVRANLNGSSGSSSSRSSGHSKPTSNGNTASTSPKPSIEDLVEVAPGEYRIASAGDASSPSTGASRRKR